MEMIDGDVKELRKEVYRGDVARKKIEAHMFRYGALSQEVVNRNMGISAHTSAEARDQVVQEVRSATADKDQLDTREVVAQGTKSPTDLLEEDLRAVQEIAKAKIMQDDAEEVNTWRARFRDIGT